MAKLFQVKRFNGVNDDSLLAKTGKRWEEWFRLLDKAGGRMMDHNEIVAYTQQQFGLPKWWGQSITLGYEQDRGLRRSHQRGSQYEVDRSRMIAAPQDAVWSAWQDPATLARWLPDPPFQIEKTTPNRILHLVWPDASHVVVSLSEKSGKTKVVISHERLHDPSEVERWQDFWTAALARLKETLEGGI